VNTTDLVAGLREYVEARREWLEAEHPEADWESKMNRHFNAEGWVESNASAIADEMERLRAEVERLSTPDMWWDSAAPEEPVRDPRDYYVFGDLKDGDCITFMAAKRLPNEVYKLVDNPKVDGDYDVVLVPDAKGGG